MLSIIHISTACFLLEREGFRILTDPVLDPPGKWYHHGFGAVSKKTSGPAVSSGNLTTPNLVLISHHQHGDNLDFAGWQVAKKAPKILSTRAASRKLPGITGLKEWEPVPVYHQGSLILTVTAVPAQHHPGWLPGFFSGEVIGFVLEFPGNPRLTVYISGDTTWFSGMKEISARFPDVDIAILHAGAAGFRYLTGPARYTMNAKEIIRCTGLFNPRVLIPVHSSGWSHFLESEQDLYRILSSATLPGTQLLFLKPGVKTEIG